MVCRSRDVLVECNLTTQALTATIAWPQMNQVQIQPTSNRARPLISTQSTVSTARLMCAVLCLKQWLPRTGKVHNVKQLKSVKIMRISTNYYYTARINGKSILHCMGVNNTMHGILHVIVSWVLRHQESKWTCFIQFLLGKWGSSINAVSIVNPGTMKWAPISTTSVLSIF